MGNGKSVATLGFGENILKKLIYSLLYIHICASVVFAQETQEDEKPLKHVPGVPLQVPVVPKSVLKKSEGELKTEKDFFKALGNTYIVLEDGSVLSAADWMLGSLKKDNSGIQMSDYESRLFLGQVARSALGLDETLVYNSITDSGPLVVYREPPPLSAPLQVLQGVIRYFVPGRDKNWDASKSGGAFSPTMKTGGTGPVLFERQFNESIMWTAEEFQERAIMQKMLDKAQKELDKEQ